MKSRKLLGCILLSVLSFTWSLSALAQGNSPTLVYAGDGIGFAIDYFFWEPNSLRLTFNVYGDEPWRQYNIQTRQIEPLPDATFRAFAPNAISQQLNPAKDRDGRPWFGYPSPNGRFVIYPTAGSGKWSNTQFTLSIGDLQTGQSLATEAKVIGMFHLTGLYRVWWSATSNAFMVSSRYSDDEPHTIYYGYDFDISIPRLRLSELESLPFNDGKVYYPVVPHDVSDNGLRALVSAITLGETHGGWDDRPRRFIILHADNFPQSRVVEGFEAKGVIGAAFAPNDESKILFVDENGLSEYDLTTNMVSLVNGNINAAWVRQELDVSPSKVFRYRRSQALFSPDGKWIALYLSGYEFDSASRLYILPTGR